MKKTLFKIAITTILFAIPIIAYAGLFDWVKTFFQTPIIQETNLGALPIFRVEQGGTGIGSYNRGDMLVATNTNTFYRLATGTESQVLKITSGFPVWGTDSTGAGATTTINGVSGPTFTFATTSDTNLGITISTSTGQVLFTSNWIGTLGDARITTSGNWNTAYTDRLKWDGGATDLVAATGRTSLGLGTMAVANTSDYLATGTAATTYLTITGAAVNYVSTTTGLTYHTISNLQWITNGTNLYASSTFTSVSIGTTTSNGIFYVATSTPMFTILQNGNVGIGTTGPTGKLEVYSTGTTSLVITSGLTASDYNQILFNGTDQNRGSIKYLQNNNTMTFNVGQVDVMTIKATGNVGIGTTSPASVLSIQATSTTPGLSVYASNSTPILFTSVGGNVGIGTTGPGTNLDVNGSGRFMGQTIPSSGAGVEVSYASNVGYLIAYDRTGVTTKAMHLGGNGATGIRVDTSGNVGIGTTTPAFTLDVYGTLRAFTSIQTASSSLGTVNAGIWQGTSIADGYVADDITLTNITQITNRALTSLTGTLSISSTTGLVINSRGGTSQDTSGWTGIPNITAGTWATSSTVIIRIPTFDFIPATTTANFNKLSVMVPSLATIAEIGCYTDAGTSSIAVYEAVLATPNASSSSIINALTCITGTATTTTFADSSVADKGIISVLITGVTGAANTWAWVRYLIAQ